MLRTGYYVKQMKSIRFFNPSSVIYMRAQVNSTTIANICWLIQIFKYQFCGFQVHFESNMVYNVKIKSDFCSKCPHYIMDYIMNLGAMFFLVSLVWNLAYIDYSLCQIWSVYMQYLQCCDHFKKMIVPRSSKGWSVAKLFLVSVFLVLYTVIQTKAGNWLMAIHQQAITGSYVSNFVIQLTPVLLSTETLE